MITLTAWTKWEGNGLVGTLSTSLAVGYQWADVLLEPGCWEPVVALGMALEGKGGQVWAVCKASHTTELCRQG